MNHPSNDEYFHHRFNNEKVLNGMTVWEIERLKKNNIIGLILNHPKYQDEHLRTMRKHQLIYKLVNLCIGVDNRAFFCPTENNRLKVEEQLTLNYLLHLSNYLQR
jgi:hypothetical protein